jgi:plastocyanin
VRRPSRLLVLLGLVALAAARELASEEDSEQQMDLTTLTGRVIVRRSERPAPARPAVGEIGMPAHHEDVDRRRSVVYLEAAPLGAFEEPRPGRAVLDQRGEAFVPNVLAIGVGTTVDFPNSDLVFHNVFSLSKARRFDLGRYPRGQSRSVRFDQAGVVQVFCEIHSHMRAFILVFAHRFFATTDAEGRYRIGGLPPGSYSVAVWNDGDVRTRRRIQTPATGGVLEQDFSLE